MPEDLAASLAVSAEDCARTSSGFLRNAAMLGLLFNVAVFERDDDALRNGNSEPGRMLESGPVVTAAMAVLDALPVAAPGTATRSPEPPFVCVREGRLGLAGCC